MSQKAPLQDRFGEAVRGRWTGVQFRDRRFMLTAWKNELADDVILQRVKGLIVTDELLGEGGGSGERFAAIESVAVVRLVLVHGAFG